MVNLIRQDVPDEPLRLERELPPPLFAALPMRIREVRAWWAGRPVELSVSTRARTPLLEPDLEEESSLAALDAAVLALAERRSERLAQTTGALAKVSGGRLVVCEIDMSIGGGEAEAASRSLFCVDDRPPWDLWLGAWGRTRESEPGRPINALLAWIPEAWLELAQAGIDACPTRCLYWADSGPIPGSRSEAADP